MHLCFMHTISCYLSVSLTKSSRTHCQNVATVVIPTLYLNLQPPSTRAETNYASFLFATHEIRLNINTSDAPTNFFNIFIQKCEQSTLGRKRDPREIPARGSSVLYYCSQHHRQMDLIALNHKA